ncbi:unnamed protein product [Sphagnum troendelagicum]|uniref:Uncharacterized protein n=1 Tax=Sphagnum troendelagicum TaxID=128251 RepID=A0ABP0V063_9BRYO
MGSGTTTTTPYATLSDLPRFEKRGHATSAPWMKEQATPHNSRGSNHEPYVPSNSQTAPFATFHNQPLPRQANKPKVQQAPWDRGEPHSSKVPIHQIPSPAPFATEPRNSSHKGRLKLELDMKLVLFQ